MQTRRTITAGRTKRRLNVGDFCLIEVFNFNEVKNSGEEKMTWLAHLGEDVAPKHVIEILNNICRGSLDVMKRLVLSEFNILYHLFTDVMYSVCMDGRVIMPCGRGHAAMGAASTMNDAAPLIADVLRNIRNGVPSLVLLTWHSGCAAFHNCDASAKHSAMLAYMKWKNVFAGNPLVQVVVAGYDMANHCLIIHGDAGDFHVCHHRESSLEQIKNGLRPLFSGFSDAHLSDLATIAWLNAHIVNGMEKDGLLMEASIHTESALILGDHQALWPLRSKLALTVTTPALDLKAQLLTALRVILRGVENGVIPAGGFVLLCCSFYDQTQHIPELIRTERNLAVYRANELMASLFHLMRRTEDLIPLARLVSPHIGLVNREGKINLQRPLMWLVRDDMIRFAGRDSHVHHHASNLI